MFTQAIHFHAGDFVRAGIHTSSSATAALLWWLVPIIAVGSAIVYVIWVSKFKDSYENETHRSVGNFSTFQATFREKKRSEHEK